MNQPAFISPPSSQEEPDTRGALARMVTTLF